MILKAFIFLSILAGSVLSQEGDMLFTTRNSYTSSVSAALGNTGIAVLSDISGGLINPALMFSNERSLKEPHGSVSAGFGRDSIFDRFIIPAGISYSTGEGTLGMFYRGLSGNNEIDQHEIILNLSGQLFNGSHGKGPVDFGINFRYEKFTWTNRSLKPLHTWELINDSTGNVHIKDTLNVKNYSRKGNLSENRILADIGFFQKNAWTNIDFGLTMRNLFGYIWTKQSPILFTKDSTDTVSTDSVTQLQREYYKEETSETKGWSKKQHRTIAIGCTYHTATGTGNKLRLSIPVDLEIYGLLDKKTRNRFVFHCGTQLSISERFFIRGGYSRSPGDLIKDINELDYINIFSGGAGIKIDPISFDFFVSKGHFGLNAVFHY